MGGGEAGRGGQGRSGRGGWRRAGRRRARRGDPDVFLNFKLIEGVLLSITDFLGLSENVFRALQK